MTTNNESNLSLELAWAKVLLKSCLDVLQTHNEPIVKRLRNDESDFLKDDYNLLKNQKKFNISEGNVKMDNINVAKNVAQRNSQDLTEQWKKGELEQGWYYVKNEFGNIFMSEYSKDYDFIGERVISGFFTEVTEISEIICEVPEYTIWRNYVTGFCEEHEYNLKLLEENQKLKSLLKECWQEIKPLWDKALWDNPERMPYSDRFIRLDKLKTKIDEVLK